LLHIVNSYNHEPFRLLGYYAALGGLKPTFRDYLSGPPSKVNLSKKATYELAQLQSSFSFVVQMTSETDTVVIMLTVGLNHLWTRKQSFSAFKKCRQRLNYKMQCNVYR
jgi:hypothetical protein